MTLEAEIVDTTAAIVPRQQSTSLVRPVADLSVIAETFQDYQAIQNKLLVADDYQQIQNKQFKKKSAWRKLSVAFGCSDEVVRFVHERNDRGRIIRSEFVVRAIAPNGRSAEGYGACDVFERCTSRCEPDCDGASHFSHAQHDIPATAQTRAKNRALSDLFGFGEVSAEEITDNEGHESSRTSTPPPQPRRNEGPSRGSQTAGPSTKQLNYLNRLMNETGLDVLKLIELKVIPEGPVEPTGLTGKEASNCIDYLVKVRDGEIVPELGPEPLRGGAELLTTEAVEARLGDVFPGMTEEEYEEDQRAF